VRFYINSGEWEIVDSVWAFEGWRMPTGEGLRRIRQGVDNLEVWKLVPKMEKKEKLWILKRTGWAV